MSVARYARAAQMVAEIIPQVLVERKLSPDAITAYKLAESDNGAAWLLAFLDPQRAGKIEHYQSADTLHHISTALHGLPVVVSNSTGLRYAVLLSRRPTIPKEVKFPGHKPGMVQIGQGVNGQPVEVSWADLGHVMVAGQTGWGKSYFLRLLVVQAILDGFKLILGDLDGTTFPRFAGHPALFCPLALTAEGEQLALEAALNEINRRARLYDDLNKRLAGGNDPAAFAESIEGYNRWSGETPLPRMLVVMDEFNSAVSSTGGPRSELATLAALVSQRGRKFGVHLVLAGQDFAKEIVGRVRDQMRTRVVFRVESAAVSRMVLNCSGAEKINVRGRAKTNLGHNGNFALVQTYHLDASQFVAEPATDGLNDYERALAEMLLGQHDGFMTEAILMSEVGLSQSQARSLRRSWEERGLAAKDRNNGNALRVVAAAFQQRDTAPAAPPDCPPPFESSGGGGLATFVQNPAESGESENEQ